MNNFILKTIQEEKELYTFEEVEAYLESLDKKKQGSISLIDTEGSYVSLVGRRDFLALGYGKMKEGKMQHFVWGLSKRDEIEVEIGRDEGSILVQKNEIMALEDALLIFACFINRKAFPAAYHLRQLEKPLLA